MTHQARDKCGRYLDLEQTLIDLYEGMGVPPADVPDELPLWRQITRPVDDAVAAPLARTLSAVVAIIVEPIETGGWRRPRDISRGYLR